jgi:hypothetical protein
VDLPTQVERGDRAYQSVLKVVQKNREVWFDVITQYQAIFGDEDAESGAILAKYVGHKVQSFLEQLRAAVARLENCGELATVHELTASFAARLGRVGADFAALVPPVFAFRAADLMMQQWQPACAQAQEAVAQGDWGEALPSVSASAAGKREDELLPPAQLLQFPVVVDLVNALLRSFNELRAFACFETQADLARDLLSQLALVAAGVDEYAARRDVRGDARFAALVRLLAEDALPFLARCFAAVFLQPTAALAIDVQALVARLRAAGGGHAKNGTAAEAE